MAVPGFRIKEFWSKPINIYIYLYIYYMLYMIPVPGPVAPPQWYGPLLTTPWPRIFHFHGIYSVLDAKPHISIVFAPVWMENLIFPWYVQHFGCRTSYFHTAYTTYRTYTTYTRLYYCTYNYLQDVGGRLPTGPTQLPHPQGGGGEPWPLGGSPNLEHIYIYMYVCIYIYVYIYILKYIYIY